MKLEVNEVVRGECVGVCAVSRVGGELNIFILKDSLYSFKKLYMPIIKKNLVGQRVYAKSHYPEKSYYPEITIINIQEDHSRFLFIHICR